MVSKNRLVWIKGTFNIVWIISIHYFNQWNLKVLSSFSFEIRWMFDGLVLFPYRPEFLSETVFPCSQWQIQGGGGDAIFNFSGQKKKNSADSPHFSEISIWIWEPHSMDILTSLPDFVTSKKLWNINAYWFSIGLRLALIVLWEIYVIVILLTCRENSSLYR